MNVLVTGGAGFVGSHLSDALVKLGHNVTVIDNFSTGKEENIENIQVNVQNKNILHAYNLDKFDVVFHLAAKPFSKAKKDWLKESSSIFQTNVVGTYQILKRINPNCHFIFASSASVYGSGRYLVETMPYNPCSAYGYSKTLAEQIIINSPRQYTIVRPGTIVGPRGRCFPNRAIWLLLNNKACAFFKNGRVLRDIINVKDVVSALISIMHKQVFGIYNLGSNTEISGVELNNEISQLAEEFDLEFKGQYVSTVPEDFVLSSTLNSDKLRIDLGWTPRYSLMMSLNEIFDDYSSNSHSSEPPSWDSL